MGKIYKQTRKSGAELYYCRFKDADGHWTTRGAGKYKKDAEALLRRLEEEVVTGVYAKGDATFDELAHKWLNDVARHKVKPSTLARYTVDIDKHLCPYFGAMKLKGVTGEKIDTFKSMKIDAGLSPRTVNSMLKQLGAVLKYALQRNYISRNPMEHVGMVKVAVEEMDYFTPPEIVRLLDAVPPEHYALFATAVLTGAREGELFALRWSDFDPEMNALYVRRTYSPEYGFTEPKSKAGNRAVQMSPELVNILKIHRDNTPYNEGDDLIFPNRDGKPMDYHNITTRVLNKALDRAGLRRIRFHDLRHTYAALCISEDANIKWLQRQMGHADIGTTMNTYGHIYPEVEEKIGGKMDSLLFDKKIVPFVKKPKDKK